MPEQKVRKSEIGQNVSMGLWGFFVVTAVVSSESGKGPRTHDDGVTSKSSLMIISLGLTLIKH